MDFIIGVLQKNFWYNHGDAWTPRPDSGNPDTTGLLIDQSVNTPSPPAPSFFNTSKATFEQIPRPGNVTSRIEEELKASNIVNEGDDYSTTSNSNYLDWDNVLKGIGIGLGIGVGVVGIVGTLAVAIAKPILIQQTINLITRTTDWAVDKVANFLTDCSQKKQSNTQYQFTLLQDQENKESLEEINSTGKQARLEEHPSTIITIENEEETNGYSSSQPQTTTAVEHHNTPLFAELSHSFVGFDSCAEEQKVGAIGLPFTGE